MHISKHEERIEPFIGHFDLLLSTSLISSIKMIEARMLK